MNTDKIGILTAVLFIMLIAGCSEVGRSFDSYNDFISYQNDEGFVFLGKFGNSYPAEITGVETQMDEISFTRKNGTPHIYRGFDGYLLKVVFLESDTGEENIIVLRSKEKPKIEKEIY